MRKAWLKFCLWLSGIRQPEAGPVPGKPLSEEKLNLALALDDNDPAWRAVQQLIATAEINANANAADDMHDPTVMAGYVGGAQHLRMLRDDLQERRETGLKLRGVIKKMEGGQ